MCWSDPHSHLHNLHLEAGLQAVDVFGLFASYLPECERGSGQRYMCVSTTMAFVWFKVAFLLSPLDAC